jgi:signal transduction histidine kinase
VNRRQTSFLWLFIAAFLVFSAASVLVLVLGAVSAWSDVRPALHESLHQRALGSGLFARMAQAMADASHRRQPGGQFALDYAFSLFNLGLAGFLVWLRPRDRTALLLAIGLVGTAAVFNLQAYGVYEAYPTTWLETSWHHFFQLTSAVSYIFALLLFPDGRLVPRWPRWALVLLYGPALAVLAVSAFRVQGTSRTVALILYFGLLTPVAGVLAQAYRYRRSPTGVERQQARLLFWALVPAVLVGLFALSRQVRATAFEAYQGRELDVIPIGLFRVFQPVFALIPVALFVGILRYRLWNIERVISRTLVYSLLAGFVSAVYVIVVVVIGGGLAGFRSTNLWLSIAATGIVAVAFQPVKERATHLANRLVYGKRATPYEVLSELSERMSDAVATEELLSRMARMIAEGTGAVRAGVWLAVAGELRPAGWWPAEEVIPEPLPMEADELPPVPAATFAVPVRHQGEPLGVLTVTKPASETLTPTEERLLVDVGAQAGLVLRNVRLTAELVARLEELRASRQRLVATEDEARRRLERNLHDGAQQQLVALNVMLGLAQQLADSGQPVGDLLAQIKAQAAEAVEDLRDLARGIYPPLLAAEGLPTALRGQERRLPFPLAIDADGVGRYPQEVEAAVYFCCLEAFQNASKHANASRVTVTLRELDGGLSFTVSDDGRGFDVMSTPRGSGSQNMVDRMDALDGRLEVVSSPGAGTTVSGWVPLGGPAADGAAGAAAAPAPGGQEEPSPSFI